MTLPRARLLSDEVPGVGPADDWEKPASATPSERMLSSSTPVSADTGEDGGRGAGRADKRKGKTRQVHHDPLRRCLGRLIPPPPRPRRELDESGEPYPSLCPRARRPCLHFASVGAARSPGQVYVCASYSCRRGAGQIPAWRLPCIQIAASLRLSLPEAEV